MQFLEKKKRKTLFVVSKSLYPFVVKIHNFEKG